MSKTICAFVLLTAALLSQSFAFDLNEFTIDPRIVKGTNSTRGQWPFYVFLKLKMMQGSAACGGSLISDQWVVTAAHCLNGASSAEVHLGALQATNLTEEGRQVFEVKRNDLHVHPQYIQLVVWNDIGLIKLPEPVKFSDTIKPVNLACNANRNMDVIAIGNGLMHTNDKTIAPILQWAPLKTISQFECLPKFPFLLFRKSVICARGADKESTCRGDSGGPLVSKKDTSLVGLTSFGSAEGCELGIAQGYTQLQSYLPWIGKTTGIEVPKC